MSMWEVTRNNEVWSNKFFTEEDAWEHVISCKRNFQGVFEVREMCCENEVKE